MEKIENPPKPEFSGHRCGNACLQLVGIAFLNTSLSIYTFWALINFKVELVLSLDVSILVNRPGERGSCTSSPHSLIDHLSLHSWFSGFLKNQSFSLSNTVNACISGMILFFSLWRVLGLSLEETSYDHYACCFV